MADGPGLITLCRSAVTVIARTMLQRRMIGSSMRVGSSLAAHPTPQARGQLWC